MATPMTVSQVVSQCKKWKVPYEVYSDAVGRPGSFTPIGFIVHHTGGPFTESDSYLKFLFEVGRPAEGIPAQLCQFSGGPSGKIYIGKMARANHAGRGDFTTRQLVGAENYPGYSREIKPGSDDYGTGNALYYGLEINYPGTIKMKNAQYNSAVRLAAAIMDFHDWSALSSIGHREHSSRKWDPGQCPLDKFRIDVRDLLIAGPEGEKTVSYKDVWRTDGLMRGPKGLATDANPTWWPESVLEHVGDALFGPIPNRYRDDGRTHSPRRIWMYTHEHSATARYDIQDTVIPLLQQIKAAQSGTARDEVLAEIQSELQVNKNLLSTVAEQLNDVRELVENFADGSLNAEQVAEQLMARFHTATAPAEQEEDI